MTPSSPCYTCSHKREDKNVCRTYDDCPIRIPTKIAPDFARLIHEPRNDDGLCEFPDCGRRAVVGKRFCSEHASLVTSRLNNGWPEKRLLEPKHERRPAMAKTCVYCGGIFHKDPKMTHAVWKNRKFCNRAHWSAWITAGVSVGNNSNTERSSSGG